jgi:hypothetical protein
MKAEIKNDMNKFAKAALLVATGIFLGAQVSQAQYLANDLVLGFDRVDNGGVGPQPADYVINLGNFQTAIGVGGSSVMNLTALFNQGTFNSIYTSLGSGVSLSVVGGNGATVGRDLFATVTRSGLGTPGVAGSASPGSVLSSFMGSGANNVAAMAGPGGLNLSAGQSTTVAQSDPNSFNTWMLSSTPPSYLSGTGIDPQTTTAGTILYADLYRGINGVNGNNLDYQGYFTLDLSGTASLTFTPAGVPEPATWALLAGGCLLLISLRRPLRKTNA